MSICFNCLTRKECIKRHQELFKNYKNSARFGSGLDIECKRLRNLILGRGKTASLKKNTYPLDINSIENDSTELNSLQLFFLETISTISTDQNSRFIRKTILNDLIEHILIPQEKRIIQIYLEGYSQTEMAQALGVSQPRIHLILKQIIKKLKNYKTRNNPLLYGVKS